MTFYFDDPLEKTLKRHTWKFQDKHRYHWVQGRPLLAQSVSFTQSLIFIKVNSTCPERNILGVFSETSRTFEFYWDIEPKRFGGFVKTAFHCPEELFSDKKMKKRWIHETLRTLNETFEEYELKNLLKLLSTCLEEHLEILQPRRLHFCPKCSSRHVECSFDNPAAIFLLKIKKNVHIVFSSLTC